MQLLNDVFDDEVAEPSTLEIDQELERLGLRGEQARDALAGKDWHIETVT